jgi:hypothetical protein
MRAVAGLIILPCLLTAACALTHRPIRDSDGGLANDRGARGDAAVGDSGPNDSGAEPDGGLCKSNAKSDAGVCVEASRCATDNGGCDVLVDCTDPAGTVSCGACPRGYAGSGADGCTPVLTDLTLSGGVLSPSFDPGVTAYTTNSITDPVATFVPSATQGVSIDIDGMAVMSGSSWTTAVPPFGTKQVVVTVSRAGHPSREYKVELGREAHIDYLKASNTGAHDAFGRHVAVSGDTLVVSAYQEASAAVGVNNTSPGQSDNTATNSGAVYVFVRHDGVWSQQAYLKASNAQAGDFFGASVGISGDTIVVGADGEGSAATGVNNSQGEVDNSAGQSGAAYVFVRTGDAWTQEAYLKASNTEAIDSFGYSVAISGDTVVVGAGNEDSGGTGVNNEQPGQRDNSLGSSGAAYVFVRDAGMWRQQAFLKASNTGQYDHFGFSVAIAGDSIAIGAIGEGSKATGANSESPGQADDSAPGSGAVYVFTRNGGAWSQQAYLKASNPEVNDGFGFTLAIDDDTLVVGASGEDSAATGVDNMNPGQGNNSKLDSGAAYVFVRNHGAWSQQAYLKASNPDASDFFESVALYKDRIVVGAFGASDVTEGAGVAVRSGAAYLFGRSGTSWTQLAYLKAFNQDPPTLSGAGDAFGFSVAISDDVLAVGAYGEGSAATGVNNLAPGPADNSADQSGAVYVFR